MDTRERDAGPALIIFGGLPGTGKSSIARALAVEIGATYVRVDTIERALRRADPPVADMYDHGYRVAHAVAEENLRLGHIVIADSVNPLAVTREAWRAVARRAGVGYCEVEIVCSDAQEHRRRVETRVPDIEGHVQPTWQQVVDRDYEPWETAHLVIDTASVSIDESVALLRAALAR